MDRNSLILANRAQMTSAVAFILLYFMEEIFESQDDGKRIVFYGRDSTGPFFLPQKEGEKGGVSMGN